MENFVVVNLYGQEIYRTCNEREAEMVARKYNAQYYVERKK